MILEDINVIDTKKAILFCGSSNLGCLTGTLKKRFAYCEVKKIEITRCYVIVQIENEWILEEEILHNLWLKDAKIIIVHLPLLHVMVVSIVARMANQNPVSSVIFVD